MRCLSKRCRAVTLSIAGFVAVGPTAGWGQPFPVKPVRYVVPFGAGASPDQGRRHTSTVAGAALGSSLDRRRPQVVSGHTLAP